MASVWRIRDWSSDVCSSDLLLAIGLRDFGVAGFGGIGDAIGHDDRVPDHAPFGHGIARGFVAVEGRDLGIGRRLARRDRGRGNEADMALPLRSEEHTSELQSLMRTSYGVFWLKKKTSTQRNSSHSCVVSTKTHA